MSPSVSEVVCEHFPVELTSIESRPYLGHFTVLRAWHSKAFNFPYWLHLNCTENTPKRLLNSTALQEFYTPLHVQWKEKTFLLGLCWCQGRQSFLIKMDLGLERRQRDSLQPQCASYGSLLFLQVMHDLLPAIEPCIHMKQKQNNQSIHQSALN